MWEPAGEWFREPTVVIALAVGSAMRSHTAGSDMHQVFDTVDDTDAGDDDEDEVAGRLHGPADKPAHE